MGEGGVCAWAKPLAVMRDGSGCYWFGAGAVGSVGWWEVGGVWWLVGRRSALGALAERLGGWLGGLLGELGLAPVD